MPRVAPEPGGNVGFCQLWCLLQELFQKLLITAIEHTLLGRIVYIQDLEQDEQTEGHKNEDVHLHPLLHGHAAVVVQGGHPPLVDLLLDPEDLLHLLLLHHVHDCVADSRLPAAAAVARPSSGDPSRLVPAGAWSHHHQCHGTFHHHITAHCSHQSYTTSLQ